MTGPKFYILEDKTPVEVDFMDYALWIKENKNIVASTKIASFVVHTVFTGLSAKRNPQGLFNTVIMGKSDYILAGSHKSYEEAERGHESVCECIAAQFN